MSDRHFAEDRPHSKTKRRMLKGILDAFFGMYLPNVFDPKPIVREFKWVDGEWREEEEEGERSDDDEQDVLEEREEEEEEEASNGEEARSEDPPLVPFKVDGEYRSFYLDAFAGKGSYEADDESSERRPQTLEGDVCDWGSPVIAVQSCSNRIDRIWEERAKKMNKLRMGRSSSSFVKEKTEEEEAKTCQFHLVNVESSHRLRLIEVVGERLGLLGWTIHSEEESEAHRSRVVTYSKIYSDELTSYTAKMEVSYILADFGQMDTGCFQSVISPFGRVKRKLLSFIDPFGITKISLERLRPLLAEAEMFLFVNLMVQPINRFKKDLAEAITELFGSEDWKAAFAEDGGPVNAKLQKLADQYELSLRSCHPKATSVSFAVRKGKTTPEKDTLFYMVFATLGHNALQKMKREMIQHVQTPEGLLAFSDYYSHKHIDVPLGRKTTDKDEAAALFEHYRGQKNVLLGKIKAFVIEETLFPYRAMVMKLLEKDGRITSVDTKGEERKRKSFKWEVSWWPDSKDPKYGNFWEVDFAGSEEEATAAAVAARKPQAGGKRRKKDDAVSEAAKKKK